VAVAQAQPLTIADHLKTLEAAVETKDFAAVYEQARAIANACAPPATLSNSPTDAYALALAHYYLAAEGLQQAMAKGLNVSQTRQAIATLASMGINAPPAGVADVKLIRTEGQEVDVKEFLVPGKTTIVDLFSVYCGWCVKYAPKLAELAKSRPDVAVVEFDINRSDIKRIDTGSPFGKQYNVRGVPQLKAFGPDGQLIAEGSAVERMFKTPIK
jgi:thiol-disulfide isomerase/thioredoxin